jgi:hypothetical protein
MDLQFGIFVGVERHDEAKLESWSFCIGFQMQSHRRTQSQRYRSQLRSNKAVPWLNAKNPTLPYYLPTAA